MTFWIIPTKRKFNTYCPKFSVCLVCMNTFGKLRNIGSGIWHLYGILANRSYCLKTFGHNLSLWDHSNTSNLTSMGMRLILNLDDGVGVGVWCVQSSCRLAALGQTSTPEHSKTSKKMAKANPNHISLHYYDNNKTKRLLYRCGSKHINT